MRQRFDSVTGWAGQQQQQQQQQQEWDGADLTMTTPSREPGFVADVVVPFFQCMVTGLLFSSLVTFLVGLTDYDGKLTPLWVGLMLAVATVAWLALLVDSRRLLRVVEKLTGLDLDRDGVVGPPKVEERYIPLNPSASRQDAARVAQEQERGRVASELAQFVVRLPSLGTDRRTWEPRIGRDKYTAFRDVLIEMGWSRWRSPRDKRQGWELVLPVREILQRIGDDD